MFVCAFGKRKRRRLSTQVNALVEALVDALVEAIVDALIKALVDALVEVLVDALVVALVKTLVDALVDALVKTLAATFSILTWACYWHAARVHAITRGLRCALDPGCTQSTFLQVHRGISCGCHRKKEHFL